MAATKEYRAHVAVFGAGVAGLTAAHELVERGYRVDVYEDAPPSWGEETCAVGGMARTQWSSVPKRPRGANAPQPMTRASEWVALPAGAARIGFPSGGIDFPATALDPLFAFLKSRAGRNVSGLIVRGFDDGEKSGLDADRAKAVREAIRSRFGGPVWWLGAGIGRLGEANVTAAQRRYVEIAIHEDMVPGEHGFRFFPAFYRHVFDTMRRTPLSQRPDIFQEGSTTVLDNVVPTDRQWLAVAGGALPIVLPRRQAPSVAEMLDLLSRTLAVLGCTLEDLTRFQAKLFRYATSCAARRLSYEETTWWDFIEGDRYGDKMRTYLESAPQLLVAMRPRTCDARTIGTVTLQLVFHHLAAGRFTDGTLNAPTSVAWFQPWREYLEHQGVTFLHGRLDHFEDVGGLVCPVVTSPDGSRKTRVLRLDYYVVALPVLAVREIVRNSPGMDLDEGDVPALLGRAPAPAGMTSQDPFAPGALDQADPGGAFAHLSGVQFYFPTDVRFVTGHAIYLDSPWALSSISQPQFWPRRRGEWDGYRGLLSVDIANWSTNGETIKKPAWACTRDEIATEVWAQIRARLQTPPDEDIPEPTWFHVDRNIGEPPKPGQPPTGRNTTPLLVNLVGRYQWRPGAPAYDVPANEPAATRFRYRLHAGGRLVFAGPHMQTTTRLTTMEAANESARHAVNALLAADGFTGDRCAIFDPEEDEPDDLRWLKSIDAELYQHGLPHFLDILGLEEAPQSLIGGTLRAVDALSASALGLRVLSGGGVQPGGKSS